MTDDCCFGFAEEREGVVARAVADRPDEPYRLIDPGEAVIPVVFEDSWCIEHGDGPGCWGYEMSWRRA